MKFTPKCKVKYSPKSRLGMNILEHKGHTCAWLQERERKERDLEREI